MSRKEFGPRRRGISLCVKGFVALAAVCAVGVAQAQLPGYWLEFDRVDRDDGDHVEIDTGMVNLPYTVELWVRPMSDQIISPIGGHADEAELHLYRHSDGYFYGFQSGPDGRPRIEGPVVDTDEWHHIALVTDTDGRQLYINGTLGAQDDAVVDPERFVTIGTREDGDYNWIGGINEVRIWDTARSQAEVEADMNQMLSGNEDGLIHYWPMNEGSGDTVEDVTGGATGSIVGSPVWHVEGPLVDTPPDDLLTVGEGGDVTLGPVGIPDYFADDVEYEWYFEMGTAEEEFLGDEAVLTLTNTSRDHEGTYTVVVSHPELPSEEFEIELWVTIVTRPPQDVAIVLGETATFSVQAIDGASFEWYFNDELVSEAEFVTIPNTEPEDYGTYTLIVNHPDYDSEEWQVELRAPDLLETPPEAVVGIPQGTDGVLGPALVYAEYEADASFSWVFDGEEVGTDASYPISAATDDQAGIYTLTVSHPDFPYDFEYEVEMRVLKFAPAAGGLGLGALAAAVALLGGAYGVRRIRK